jgi:hypothetical protein
MSIPNGNEEKGNNNILTERYLFEIKVIINALYHNCIIDAMKL